MAIDPKAIPRELQREINAVARALVGVEEFKGSLPEALGFAAIVVGASLVAGHDGSGDDLIIPAFGAVIAGYEMRGKRPDVSTPEKMMALVANLTGIKVEVMRKGPDGQFSKTTIEPQSHEQTVDRAIQGTVDQDHDKFPWFK